MAVNLQAVPGTGLVITPDNSGNMTFSTGLGTGNVITLPIGTGTFAVQGVSSGIVSGNIQNPPSGTAIPYLGIPSYVKRITVSFVGTTTSSSSPFLVQLGSGSVTTTGYTSLSNSYNQSNGTAGVTSTAGFIIGYNGSSGFYGQMIITALGSNVWASSHNGRRNTTDATNGGGGVTLSGVCDRVNITTTNGTDTFNAGTINILYE
jgi:hypothetical protein